MGVAADHQTLIARARAADKRSVGRLISIVEDDSPAARTILQTVYPDSAAAWVTGITGAPGAGKSTLVDGLIAAWRREGKRVAVLAIDPTSPFTGGALLGDRIRMQRASADPDVLVRSMATRGWLGGLARATARVATLCAGLGYDEVLIETVGVGQSEVDIADAADTTIVVVTPGWGDSVQVAKAGILEIGDVLVVNKADRAGAAEAVGELREMLALNPPDAWRPPVTATTATSGVGVDDLMAALAAHREFMGGAHAQARVEARRVRDLYRALDESLHDAIEPVLAGIRGREITELVSTGSMDPWAGADAVMDEIAAVAADRAD